MKKFFMSVMVMFLCLNIYAENIKNGGVIGNSGEQGENLVRFGEKSARGIGVAYDRFGKLWDRAGEGVLNSYSLDGRMLGQFSIPKGQDRDDKLTLVGDTLVLRIRGWLYTLNVNAPSGSAAIPLNIKAERISFGNCNDEIAIVDENKNVVLLNPETGKLSNIIKLPFDNCRYIEIAPDGTIYFLENNKLYKIEDGRFISDWERAMRGERMQLLGGSWFSHGWHGTIYRFNQDIQPDPGVILGGASGSFIGHLPQNSELVNGRGMAHIRDNLYAVSGLEGIMHLLEWNPKTKKMSIIRRIGSLQNINGIGLDFKSRMWAFAGSWEWYDRPDTPIRYSINPPEYPGISQAVMLDNDYMVAYGFMWGTPAVFSGNFDKEINGYRIQKGFDLRKGATGTAVYYQDKKLTLLSIDSKGSGQTFYIGSDGKFKSSAGDVTLETKSDTSNWTSLAMKENTLLAGADGYVIEFESDGKNWKEVYRWNSWGGKPEEKFGGEIYISADSGLLWVSDTMRHRVLCFDLNNKKLLGNFGELDFKGSGLQQLDNPKMIIGRGKTRAVVFDSGNQRLVKLEKEK